MRKLALGLGVFALACGTPGRDAPFSGGGGLGGSNVGDDPLPTSLFSGQSVRSERAAPFVGGTLLVTSDDTTAVVADPDRDRVSFVNLHTLAVTSVELEPGALPGRLTEAAPGRVAAILQGSGSIASFSLDGTELFRVPACSHPRGIAYVAAQNALVVACRSGVLLKLDADSGRALSRQRFDEDLTDVLVRGDGLVLTRERSAELLYLDAAGAVVHREAPSASASVAFRSVLLPNDDVLLVHQATTAVVGDQYGSFEIPCGAQAVTTELTIATTSPKDGLIVPPTSPDPRDSAGAGQIGFEGHRLAQLVGPIDVAISRRAGKIALLAVGNVFAADFKIGSLLVLPFDPVKGTIVRNSLDILDNCQLLRAEQSKGQAVAVALDSRGRAFVQSREPAGLVLDNGVIVPLGQESRADTGLALFYMNTSRQASCASCHPGGLEDGRTWFAVNDLGEQLPRRTQSLAGGLLARAPYHWSGEFPTLPQLIDEVMLQRMMLPVRPTPAQVEALGTWLDGIPAPTDLDDVDQPAAERGRALFFDPDVGCSTCHGGGQFTDDSLHDIGTGGRFFTPPLVAVRARAPYFHDGCAPNLSRVIGACGGSAHDLPLSSVQIGDLAEFLRSL